MGHQGSIENKVQAIQQLDKLVVSVVKEAMDASGEDYRMLITPDHPTPIRCRTHTGNPVPYILYDSRHPRKGVARYTEEEAAKSGNFVEYGYMLMNKLTEK